MNQPNNYQDNSYGAGFNEQISFPKTLKALTKSQTKRAHEVLKFGQKKGLSLAQSSALLGVIEHEIGNTKSTNLFNVMIDKRITKGHPSTQTYLKRFFKYNPDAKLFKQATKGMSADKAARWFHKHVEKAPVGAEQVSQYAKNFYFNLLRL